jgi:hypothetical protein
MDIVSTFFLGKAYPSFNNERCSERHTHVDVSQLGSIRGQIAMWVAGALSVLVFCAFAFNRLWHPGGRSDLGWMTERWLVELRAHQSGESR